jgi:3-hydroxyacyl-CoA dehydrogenase
MTVHIIDFRKASTSPLNPFGRELRHHVRDSLQTAMHNANVSCIVLTGGDQHFSAGADLTEFSNFMKPNQDDVSLLDVIEMLDACPKPTVAAIAGTCMGGGLEVALACQYRVVLPNAKLALPEVHVGVIPGAGVSIVGQ